MLLFFRQSSTKYIETALKSVEIYNIGKKYFTPPLPHFNVVVLCLQKCQETFVNKTTLKWGAGGVIIFEGHGGESHNFCGRLSEYKKYHNGRFYGNVCHIVHHIHADMLPCLC